MQLLIHISFIVPSGHGNIQSRIYLKITHMTAVQFILSSLVPIRLILDSRNFDALMFFSVKKNPTRTDRKQPIIFMETSTKQFPLANNWFRNVKY